jgi:hypothetical protein
MLSVTAEFLCDARLFMTNPARIVKCGGSEDEHVAAAIPGPFHSAKNE